MSHLKSWFLKHQERQDRFASLNDLMFAESKRHYPQFRLSLFNFQLVFHFFTHALIFYFLSHELTNRSFTLVIAISSWKMLIVAAWWGGLELLRSQVRNLYRINNLLELEKAIGFWLILTVFICIPITAAGVYFGYTAYIDSLYNRPFIIPLYASLVCLMLVIRLPVSTLHSGIYGISRVIRPHFSMIMAYSFGLLVLALTWPTLKIFGIFLAILTQSLVSSYLTFYYARYMYRLYNFSVRRPKRFEFRDFFKRLSPLHFALAALSNIFMISDSLLIIGFYYFTVGNSKGFLFLQIIYLISPLIQASTNWARLFYFDRKRLRNSQLDLFINEYDRNVAYVAAFLGLTFGLYALIASYVLISPVAASYVATFLPFFLLRSLIANLQVKKFSYFYYADVILSGLVLTSGIIAIYLTNSSFLMKSAALVILMIVVHAFLKKDHFPQFQSTRYQGLYTNLYSWLAHLKRTPEFIEVYRLHLDSYIKLGEKIALIRKLSEELALTDYQVCSIKEKYLMVFRRVQQKTELLPATYFARLSGGLLKKVDRNLLSNISLTDGVRYYTYSFEDSPIINDLMNEAHRFADIPENLTLDQVTALFLETFPEGTFYDPCKKPGPLAESIPIDSVRKFTSLVWQYLFRQRKRMKADMDVTVLFDEEIVKVIFVIPKKESDDFQEKLLNWHNFIHATNMKLAAIACGN